MSTMRGLVVVGEQAVMSIPLDNLAWIARYGDIKAARYSVAACLESYAYLLGECSAKECARRMRIARKAFRDAERRVAL